MGYMYLWEYICLSELVQLRLSIEGKNIFACFSFQIFTHISLNIVFKCHYMYTVKCICEKSWENILSSGVLGVHVHLSKLYILICWNAIGVHGHLSECCRGTWSFVGMLKGYMVRKRLGTPALAQSAEELGRWYGNWKLLFLRPKSKYEYIVHRLSKC